jgi:hypothetical protein
MFEKTVVMARAKDAKIEEHTGPYGTYKKLIITTEDNNIVGTILKNEDIIGKLAAYKTITPINLWVILYKKNSKGWNELLNIVSGWVL